MKIKANYALREVAGSWVVLPLAEETLSFNGMINLNDTGAFLWKTLESGASMKQLAEAVTKEYDVDPARALADVERFVEKLREVGCIEE